MRDRLLTFQEQTGNNYNLEATPAEGTSYRLARIDAEKFPGIVSANGHPAGSNTEGETARLPSTPTPRSFPVQYSDDIFEVLDLQDELQTKYTGGTVVHLFVGEEIADPHNVRKLVKLICKRYHLPYFTVTPTFSVCPVHGYLSGRQETCPHCGAAAEVYSRVVGYLRPVNQWNEGKVEELSASAELFKLS